MDSVCQFSKTKISHENSVCRSGKSQTVCRICSQSSDWRYKTTDASASLKSSVTNPIRNPISYICFQYDDIRMGANMESFLKGFKDPRISSYFNQATIGGKSDYFGIRNGIQITNKSQYTPFPLLS